MENGQLAGLKNTNVHVNKHLEMAVVQGVLLISAKFPGIIHMCRILCTHQQACLDLQLKTQPTYLDPHTKHCGCFKSHISTF